MKPVTALKWTPELIQFLRDNYPVHGKDWCVEKMGLKEHQVRYKASHLGLKSAGISEAWKNKQIEHAKKLTGRKRPAQALLMKKLNESGKLARSQASIDAGVAKMKQWVAANGHPKGATGIVFSQATKAVMSAKGRARWERMTPEQRAAQTLAKIVSRRKSGKPIPPPRGSWKYGWREVGQQRRFFRSRWEANYARFLEWQRAQGAIASWEHEPHAFFFPTPQVGCVSYLPDFRVTTIAGAVEWHEVKGWMDERSRLTLEMMATHFPGEHLVVVREKQYRAIERRVATLIPEWEPDGREACIVVTITPLVKANPQASILEAVA